MEETLDKKTLKKLISRSRKEKAKALLEIIGLTAIPIVSSAAVISLGAYLGDELRNEASKNIVGPISGFLGGGIAIAGGAYAGYSNRIESLMMDYRFCSLETERYQSRLKNGSS